MHVIAKIIKNKMMAAALALDGYPPVLEYAVLAALVGLVVVPAYGHTIFPLDIVYLVLYSSM